MAHLLLLLLLLVVAVHLAAASPFHDVRARRRLSTSKTVLHEDGGVAKVSFAGRVSHRTISLENNRAAGIFDVRCFEDHLVVRTWDANAVLMTWPAGQNTGAILTGGLRYLCGVGAHSDDKAAHPADGEVPEGRIFYREIQAMTILNRSAVSSFYSYEPLYSCTAVLQLVGLRSYAYVHPTPPPTPPTGYRLVPCTTRTLTRRLYEADSIKCLHFFCFYD